MRFSYLPALGIVVVCPQAGSPPSLLSNLFPDDTGQGTPNPANHHGRAARASALGVFEFPADVQCRPYRWAQWLAGLHFPAPGAAASSAVAGDGGVVSPIEPSTRAVGAALRSRARTHVALAAQMKSFATKGVSSSEDKVPEGMGNVELRRCSWFFCGCLCFVVPSMRLSWCGVAFCGGVSAQSEQQSRPCSARDGRWSYRGTPCDQCGRDAEVACESSSFVCL